MDKKKIRVAFILPQTKWWAFYVYNDISKWLLKNHWDFLEIDIFNSKIDWFKLHFKKYDIMFSVIPFIFKPIWVNKFYYLLVWNFEKEKKKNTLGNKLLYLSPNTIKFSDKVILMSEYLLEEINELKKNRRKIYIIPNYINYWLFESVRRKNSIKLKNSRLSSLDELSIFTLTSFKFFDKWKWILNLAKVISQLSFNINKKIIWNIAWNDESENFCKIKKDFDKISFNNNIEINWKGWIDRKIVLENLKKSNLFLYWSLLDVFPTVVLEAMASWLPVFVNNFSPFRFILPESNLCKTENEMLHKILDIQFNKENDKSVSYSKQYDINIVWMRFLELIKFNFNEKK